MKPMDEFEAQVLWDIQLKTAHLVGWFRNSTGRAQYTNEKTGKVTFVPYGVGGNGGPDLIGVRRRDGRTIALEVKRPGEKPRKDQLAALECFRNCGAIALWADNVETVLKAIEQ